MGHKQAVGSHTANGGQGAAGVAKLEMQLVGDAPRWCYVQLEHVPITFCFSSKLLEVRPCSIKGPHVDLGIRAIRFVNV